MKEWTFITSHGAVLALIVKCREIKAIDIASELRLTERSVRRIIADLIAASYVTKDKKGRVNPIQGEAGLATATAGEPGRKDWGAAEGVAAA